MIQSIIEVLTISPYITLAAIFLVAAIILSALNGLIDIAAGLSVLFALIFGVIAIFHFIYTGGLSSLFSFVLLTGAGFQTLEHQKD